MQLQLSPVSSQEEVANCTSGRDLTDFSSRSCGSHPSDALEELLCLALVLLDLSISKNLWRP